MNGVYNGVLRCGVWTVKCENGLWSVVSRKKIPLTSPAEFHLVLNSKTNKAAPTLVRSIFLLGNESGRAMGDTCLLQYHLTDGTENVKVDVQKHGNCSKTNTKPFQPMKKSSLRAIQERVISQLSIVFGMSRNFALRDIPKNGCEGDCLGAYHLTRKSGNFGLKSNVR